MWGLQGKGHPANQLTANGRGGGSRSVLYLEMICIKVPFRVMWLLCSKPTFTRDCT